MNIITDLKIGERVEIEVKKNDNTHGTGSLISQVEDKNKNTLFLSMPFSKGTPYPLEIGLKVKIIFFREEKGIFSFVGEVIDLVNKNVKGYLIQPISKVKKEQRRFYFRLQVRSKITIKSNDNNIEEVCFTKDLSGGGAQINCKNNFGLNNKVECILHLEDGLLKATGKIVRKEKDIGNNSYNLGINFIGITEHDRNKIISYIFKEQRLLRKRGLI
ncbi:flagellar brake protein [Serpentinicella sp. ANB-PHB4]|uniref:flagellar brake protein n=1 Tax=Serpentinicella sp. ANB-PHB4 TaxID=3074076 RepID=UPI00285FD7C7|nr:flagellar brake protein [Serpentinicella sp. ANB-PHB4]MDR5658247.1 flagellar brake protein [Serpentinicella sp. ANB-PHB4]